MRTIRVTMREVKAAIARAELVSEDWQAELIEIILLPKVHQRWRELNQHMDLRLERHPGLRHAGYTPEQNRAIGDRGGWGEFAGYKLAYYGGLQWNSVRGDCFMHSASTTWDGIRRETRCRFVEALRMIAYGHDHESLRDLLREAKINLVEAAQLAVA